MTNTANSINCPNCGTAININELAYLQLEEKIKGDYAKKFEQRRKEFESTEKNLQIQQTEIVKARHELKEQVQKELALKLKEERKTIESIIRKQLNEEQEDMVSAMREDLERKNKQVKELNAAKLQIERLQLEKGNLKAEIELSSAKELNEKLAKEKQIIRLQEEEKSLLKIRALEKQLKDQKELADEMKRKAEQGSVQLQGEVLELELERIIRDLFIYDEITEVKKGQRGADVLQLVRTNNGIACGKIYYESKRTKNFDYNWIKKLKEDNLSVKADALILVTEAMPDGYEGFFCKDDVWICSLREVKPLALAIRHGIMEVFRVSTINQGRESKMELLYNYLTGQEFSSQFSAILDGFKTIQENHANEKLRMQKLWKEREKQLDRILLNSVDFYGSLKAIAGNSIQNVPMLEGDSKVALQ